MLQAISLLLITSLCCIGLLATWAATSPRHWFWRTGVFVAVMLLLLLIPAYEAVVAFSIQGAVVATGVKFFRRKNRLKDSPSADNGTRFSLATIMLATVYVAITVAVAVRIPEQNLYAWQSLVLIGLSSGLTVLMSLWIIFGQIIRRSLRILVAFITIPLLAIPLTWGDWLIHSFVDYSSWPPQPDTGYFFGLFGEYRGLELYVAWLFINFFSILLFSIAIWLFSFLAFSAKAKNAGAVKTMSHRKRIFAGGVLLSLLLTLAIPPSVIYYRLMTPLPIPETVIPNPNGWDELYAASKQAESSSHINTITNYDTATKDQLAAAVEDLHLVYLTTEIGLNSSPICPVKYDETWFDIDTLTPMRNLARALACRSTSFRLERKFKDSANSAMEGIQLGYASRRGGLMIDALVGIACSGVGQSMLYQVRNKLTAEHCQALTTALRKFENLAESPEEVLLRDRIWKQYANGWHGHLMYILDEYSNESLYNMDDAFLSAYRREQALMRLLQVELAIQAWQITHQQPPTSLSELVPQYLPEIPVDPFSPGGSLLQYRQAETGYILYSVGQNGKDDDGKPHPREDYVSDYELGDLRLDAHFAPDTEQTDEDETSTEPVEGIGTE